MKKIISVEKKEKVILLADKICYWQRPDWCEGRYRQLNFSLMKPRCHYEYDEDEGYPLLLWITGGSFIEENINIWMPELVYFAKHGYAVAGVDYSVNGRTHFPMQLEDIKACIRYIRAHAKELHIDPGRIAVMGESAGGYFSALTGLTGNTREYDKGDFLEYSSAVQAAVPWYPPCHMSGMKYKAEEEIAKWLDAYQDLETLPDKKTTPPFLILHGTADRLVSYKEGEMLYDALQAAGVPSDLILIEGADHADHYFIQEEVKKMILDFLNQALSVEK